MRNGQASATAPVPEVVLDNRDPVGDHRRFKLRELESLGYGSVDSLRRKVKRARPVIKPMNGAFRLRVSELESILESDESRRSVESETLAAEAKRIAEALGPVTDAQKAALRSALGGVS